MANSKILLGRTKLKYDTESNWTSKDTILLSGEVGFSSDKNGQFKIGDGVSTWSELEYNHVDWSNIDSKPTWITSPKSLIVKLNNGTTEGTNMFTYNMSSAKTINITPSSIGAATSSHTHSSLVPTNITGSTVDLNDYTLSSGSPKIQYYVEHTKGGAANITNNPVSDNPFLLKVELIRYNSSTDYITKQTYTCTNTKQIYTRWCTNSTWTSWLPEGFSATPTANQVLIASNSTGAIKTSGYTINSSVPSNAIFTDSKVTNILNSSSRAYITGTTSSTTNTGTQIFNINHYIQGNSLYSNEIVPITIKNPNNNQYIYMGIKDNENNVVTNNIVIGSFGVGSNTPFERTSGEKGPLQPYYTYHDQYPYIHFSNDIYGGDLVEHASTGITELSKHWAIYQDGAANFNAIIVGGDIENKEPAYNGLVIDQSNIYRIYNDNYDSIDANIHMSYENVDMYGAGHVAMYTGGTLDHSNPKAEGNSYIYLDGSMGNIDIHSDGGADINISGSTGEILITSNEDFKVDSSGMYLTSTGTMEFKGDSKFKNSNGTIMIQVNSNDTVKLRNSQGTNLLLTGTGIVSELQSHTFSNKDGGSVALILDRGTKANWKILNGNGNLFFQSDYTASKQSSYYNVLTLYYNSGNAIFKGQVTATKFIGNIQGNDIYVENIYGLDDININVYNHIDMHNNELYNIDTMSINGDITMNGTNDINGANSIKANEFFENGTSLIDKYKSYRQALVGQNGNYSGNPYYKFASCTVNTVNHGQVITFKVYRGFGDHSTMVGILTAHFRTLSSGTWSSGELVWEYAASGIDTSKFILAHSTTNPIVVELWVCIESSWAKYHFDVISEGSEGDYNSMWELYTTITLGSEAAITEGYEQIESTLSTLKNSISGNADSASTIYSTTTNPSNTTAYYIPFHSYTPTGNKSLLNNNGIRYYTLEGTTSTNGTALLCLGNNTTSGTAGNKYGIVRLYTTSSGYVDLTTTSSTSSYTITLPASSGTVALTTSNVTSATKLQTARTINGTSFNGTASITTANWGTARNIKIGNSTKSVNGSANVTWTLSEIGAATVTKIANGTDIDTIKTIGFYNAGSGNKCENKPAGIDAFGLIVYKTADGYITQDLISGNNLTNKRFTRQYNGSWSDWICLPTFTKTPESGKVLVSSDVNGGISSSSYTIASNVPSNAVFTDTKVTNTLNNSAKAYITGTTSSSTNTGTQVFDSGVYLGTEAGSLYANSINLPIKLTYEVTNYFQVSSGPNAGKHVLKFKINNYNITYEKFVHYLKNNTISLGSFNYTINEDTIIKIENSTYSDSDLTSTEEAGNDNSQNIIVAYTYNNEIKYFGIKFSSGVTSSTFSKGETYDENHKITIDAEYILTEM